MNTKNKLLVISLITILTYSISHAQETSKELGIEFYESVKSNDTSKIKKIIPKPEVLIEFAISMGMEKTEQEISEFLRVYPDAINQFTARINQLHERGKSYGIDWDLTEFTNVEIILKEQKITELQEPVFISVLNVVFHFKEEKYRLIINWVFEYNGKWYLADDKPRIEKY